MQPYKKTFYREGRTYSLIILRNALAGYLVSVNGRTSHYEIFLISKREGGTEYLIESNEDHYMKTYETFLKMWEILNRTADKRRLKETGNNLQTLKNQTNENN